MNDYQEPGSIEVVVARTLHLYAADNFLSAGRIAELAGLSNKNNLDYGQIEQLLDDWASRKLLSRSGTPYRLGYQGESKEEYLYKLSPTGKFYTKSLFPLLNEGNEEDINVSSKGVEEKGNKLVDITDHKKSGKRISEKATNIRYLSAQRIIAAASIAAGILGAFAAGYNRGAEAGPDHYWNELACSTELAILREQFRENCLGKPYDQVDGESLKDITLQRDMILKKYSCEEQDWTAHPELPHDIESTCRVDFKLR